MGSFLGMDVFNFMSSSWTKNGNAHLVLYMCCRTKALFHQTATNLHLATTNFLVIGSPSYPNTNKIVQKEMMVKTP